jgi:hypothetical protein
MDGISSARQLGLSGAQGAGTSDPYAAQTQPAGLTHQSKASFSLNLKQTSFDLEGVVPRSEQQRWMPSSGLPAETRRASDFGEESIAHLGINLPILRNVNFGISGSLPTDRLAGVHAYTNHDPQYVLYNDRLVRPQVFSALAARLPFGLSLGAGLYYALKADGELQVAVTGEQMENRLQLDLKPEYIPYGSLQWASQRESAPQYYLDVYYRAAQKTPSKLDVAVSVGLEEASIPLNLGAELIPFYDPEIWKTAAAYEANNLALYLTVQRTSWSDYRSAIVNFSGPDAPSISQNSLDAKSLGLRDTMAYHLGTQYTSSAQKPFQHAARLGVSFEESAVEKSSPSVLLVDSDKFSLAAGYGLQIDEPQLAAYPIQLDLGLRQTWLQHKSFLDSQGRRANSGGKTLMASGGVSYVF